MTNDCFIRLQFLILWKLKTMEGHQHHKFGKSRSEELRKLFEHAITVKHIAQRLDSCDGGENAANLRYRMKAGGIDVIGVREGDGDIYGYIKGKDIGEQGAARDFAVRFHMSQLVAESMPLIDLFPIIKHCEMVFVLEKNSINYVVTQGDLDKSPVRLLFFGLISLLEMNFQRIIRIYFPNDSWQHLLEPNELESVVKFCNRKRATGSEADLLECLPLFDKIEIMIRNPNLLRRLNLPDEGSARDSIHSIRELRNKLAHVHSLAEASSWPEIIDLGDSIQDLLEKCEEITDTGAKPKAA